MKRCRNIIMIACLCVGFMLMVDKVNAALETITIGTAWSGTVKDVKYLNFTPSETGFYDVDLVLDDSNLYAVGKVEEADTGKKLNWIYNGYSRNNLYLRKDITYTVTLTLSKYDEKDGWIDCDGDVSITISKSTDVIEQLGDKQVGSTLYRGGYKIFKISPSESGTYTFSWDGDYGMVTLYQIGDEEELINPQIRGWTDGAEKNINFSY